METKDQFSLIQEAFPPAAQLDWITSALSANGQYLFYYQPEQNTLELPAATGEFFHLEKEVQAISVLDFSARFLEEAQAMSFFKLLELAALNENPLPAVFTLKNQAGKIQIQLQNSDPEKGVCIGIIQVQSDREQRALDLSSIRSSMLEMLPCGVLSYTLPEREVLIANSEARRILNLKEDAPINESVYDHIPKAEWEIISQAASKLTRLGDQTQFRFHTEQNDGTELTIECVSSRQDLGPDQPAVLSVMQDITEEEKYEKLLHQERQQYRDALNLSSLYAFDFDVDTGLIEKTHFYMRHHLPGSGFEEMAFPIHYNDMAAMWQNAMHPEPLFDAEWDCNTIESIRQAWKEGQTYAENESYVPGLDKFLRNVFLLSRDPQTGHVKAVCIVTDISKTVRSESQMQKELLESNARLQKQLEITQAFSRMYFGTWEVDLENQRLEEISAPEWLHCLVEDSQGDYIKAQEILQDRFVKMDYHEELSQFVDIHTLASRLMEKSSITMEYEGTISGWRALTIIPTRWNEEGAPVQTLFAVSMIDEQKQRELRSRQLLQEAYNSANRANMVKTEFLSNMSHDIRTPMNAIIGLVAIASTHLDDRQRIIDCLSKITVSSKHLLGIINDVLDMSRIESGKMYLNCEEFKLSELVDNLLIMNKIMLESKGHQIAVHIQDVEHETAIGDSQRISQVLMNLLTNAIKYTPANGNISLTIREKEVNKSHVGCYEFIVEDNGIGMDEAFVKTIFEPFSRARDDRTANIQGTGLGMPIAHNIVQMMNGSIQIDSRLNEGTKITVTLFLELPADEVDFDTEALAELPVLVADDDLISAENTCHVLNQLGMKAEAVLTGTDALHKVLDNHVKNTDYFAVILDWKMPKMDGLQTADAIRQKVGDSVPIIILSAYDWSDIEKEARQVGVNAFISKPLFRSRLVGLFKNLLQNGPEELALPEAPLMQEDFAGRKILLAEDNDLNAEIAEEILSMVNLQVDRVVNGQEALHRIANPEERYDLVFMDIRMPIMNGYEATEAIRSLPSKYARNIPIVAMTANAFVEDVIQAKNAGMNDHIAKPLDLDQLQAVLHRWIS